MQPLLSSSTGETEQSGITCGGTLTVGFEGGRIPAALAGAAVPDMTMTEEPTTPAKATAIRPMEPAPVRARLRSCFTLPFAPLCAWKSGQLGHRNISVATLRGGASLIVGRLGAERLPPVAQGGERRTHAQHAGLRLSP
jgi:hypothetical protein